MEALMTKPALVTDHLVLRTASEEAEIAHLRQALNEGHYLNVGFHHHTAKPYAALRLLKTPPPQIN